MWVQWEHQHVGWETGFVLKLNLFFFLKGTWPKRKIDFLRMLCFQDEGDAPCCVCAELTPGLHGSTGDAKERRCTEFLKWDVGHICQTHSPQNDDFLAEIANQHLKNLSWFLVPFMGQDDFFSPRIQKDFKIGLFNKITQMHSWVYVGPGPANPGEEWQIMY